VDRFALLEKLGCGTSMKASIKSGGRWTDVRVPCSNKRALRIGFKTKAYSAVDSHPAF
jgi:hypothetical protein